jgi:hypothetical protein
MATNNKYSTIPTGSQQIFSVSVLLVICGIVFLDFPWLDANFDMQTKRWISRFSTFCQLSGSMLFSYGILYSRKSQKNLNHALDVLKTSSPRLGQLQTERKLEANMSVGNEENELIREIRRAEDNKELSENFSKHESKVIYFATGLLVLGTILQAVIA